MDCTDSETGGLSGNALMSDASRADFALLRELQNSDCEADISVGGWGGGQVTDPEDSE